MDPYLEDTDIWPDFHTMFIAELRKAIARVIPRQRYRLVLGRHAWIEQADDDGWRRSRPDLYIKEAPDKTDALTMGQTIVAPVTVILPEARSDGPAYLQVIDRDTQRVVTVIELLSPSNKRPGDDHESYLAKRVDYLARRINLVEIDLLREGERMPADQMPADVDYCILVSHANELPRAGLWPFSVRDQIPSPIPIPLLPADGDLAIDLRRCFNETFDASNFVDEIDYSSPPPIPLEGNDATWAAMMLQGRIL
jgi:hypothetical protein